jgi:hypothetical protein
MLDYRPHLLPKLRSEALMAQMKHYPCTLRISSIIPGHRCASQDTVVGVHLPVNGKGTSTKVTDFAAVAGCLHCHNLVDHVDVRIDWIAETYPAVLYLRYLNATMETITLLTRDEVILVPDGEMI